MSDDEDPFERLGEPDEREGDPFEQLGESDESGDTDTDADADADTEVNAGADPEPLDDDSGLFETGPVDGETDQSETGPVGGVEPGMSDPPDEQSTPGEFEEEFIERDADPGEAGVEPDDDPFSGMDDRDGDPFGGGESAFEAVDVDTVDEDEVWASLSEDTSTAPRQSKRYAEVSKHRFCEQCEHFSEPPAAHCTHDEAEIVEYLDMETVRLLNCPVVAEQREIERDE